MEEKAEIMVLFNSSNLSILDSQILCSILEEKISFFHREIAHISHD